MPRVCAVDKLNAVLKSELDKRLRDSGYGEIIAHAQWLLETHGIKISKSALGRYSTDQKTRDKAEILAAKHLRGNLAERKALDLLVELGTIRIREYRIIKRLEQIGFID